MGEYKERNEQYREQGEKDRPIAVQAIIHKESVGAQCRNGI